MNIIAPILTVTGLGVIFGIGLAAASKKFCVVSDPRLEKIYDKLPGANCGACGMPGCMGFAEGLIKGTCTVEKCAVTQEESRKEIANILGIEAKAKLKKIAVLLCHGGSNRVKNKLLYSGIHDCIAANAVLGGPKACAYGCIGYGSCVAVCPFGAITMDADNLPQVNGKKCTACGKCVAVCPKKLFILTPAASIVTVACSSHDTGKDTKAVCPVGCIACKICEKTCKFDAIHVTNNLSVIDYTKCTSCGACVKSCPAKTILIRQLPPKKKP